jgi:DNA modification methylase
MAKVTENVPKRITLKVSEVKTNPNNPRVIKDEKFKSLVKSIQDFPEMAEIRPIVVNADMIILGGNMRFKAMKEAGWKEVPVIIADHLTPEQEREFIIKDNTSGGDWDWEMLAMEWDADKLEEWGLDLPELIDPTELEAEEDDFEVPEGGIETDIVLGDLFEIGEHRLLCGDSTCSDAVAKLMNGEKADMVFTDPPYGISHSGKGIKGSATENDFGEILNDDDVSIAIDNFNLVSSLFPNATLIYWGANYYPNCFPNGYGWLFWDKDREGNTFSGGEIAFVNKGVRFDVFKHRWHGMIKASEMGEKRVHPTQKPIELVKFCFENYNAGNLVADFFLGSGSTMVASHQLKRKCYGMELDPKYCQVIIDRMLKLDPGLKITKNGQPYAKS